VLYGAMADFETQTSTTTNLESKNNVESEMAPSVRVGFTLKLSIFVVTYSDTLIIGFWFCLMQFEICFGF
jgi:hypothetical protein